MSKAISIIDDNIAALKKQIGQLEDSIGESQSLIQQTSGELSVLNRIRQQLIDAGETNSAPNGSVERGVKASAAIIRLLSTQGPLTTTKIMDALEGRIESKAANKRRLIFQTLVNLSKRGRVLKQKDSFSVPSDDGGIPKKK